MLFSYWYKLYNEPTRHEIMLEREIAKLGERYRAQHIFAGLRHIADFALLDRRLIIEVDGDSHRQPAQKKKDLRHTLGLKAAGWTVVRVSNYEVEVNPAAALAAAFDRVDLARQTSPESLRAELDRLEAVHPARAPAPKPAKRDQQPSASRRRKARGTAPAGKGEIAAASNPPAPRKRTRRARDTSATH